MSAELAIFAQQASGVAALVARMTSIAGASRELRQLRLAEVRQAATATLLIRMGEYQIAMARRHIVAIVDISRELESSSLSGEGYEVAMRQLRELGRVLNENVARLQNGIRL